MKRRTSQQSSRDDFARECRLLASLHHHNVARLVGVVSDGDTDGEMIYRVILVVSQFGWIDFILRCSTILLGQEVATAAAQKVEKVFKFLDHPAF